MASYTVHIFLEGRSYRVKRSDCPGLNLVVGPESVNDFAFHTDLDVQHLEREGSISTFPDDKQSSVDFLWGQVERYSTHSTSQLEEE